MFKNAILYKIDLGNMVYVEACIHLSDHQFASCGPTQEKSSGWVPPREANGAMIELVGGQWILKMMTEVKAVPAEVINRKTAERCAQIEASTGRKPGKKETRDLKDDIRMELLPKAFSKQSAALVWIDKEAGVMLVDASSQAKADEVVTLLVASVPGVTVHLINTRRSPSSCMSDWLLMPQGPDSFSIDRECELRAFDESKAVVKYSKHRLDIDEVRDHIIGGKIPTRLAMTWNDRVSFVLTEGLQLKKLVFLDVVFNESNSVQYNDSFDADVAIATGELVNMLPDLLDALGGEVVA